MIDLGEHALYIVASYVGAAIVIALLILRAALESREQKAKLKRLEDAGVRRRSSGDTA